MTLIAFTLIFFSVFLHAGWNFASKKSVPSGAFYFLMSATSTFLWMPVLFFVPVAWSALPGRFWMLLGGSVVCEVFYVLGLAYAYRLTDISLAYPLGRALPVLVIAFITGFLGIGKVPTVTALLGMLIIFLGSALLPLKSFLEIRGSTYFNKAFLFILLIVAGTTGYTILDSMASAMVRNSPGLTSLSAALVYLFLIEAGLSAALGVYVACLPKERMEFRRFFLKTPVPHLAGIASSSAYVLILLSMGHVSNVSYVQAFRQMSLPIGVLMGILILKESCHLPKMIGLALILIGLILTSF